VVHFVVFDGNRVVGYLVWPKSARGITVDAFIAVDEEALCAADAVRLMLSHLASASIRAVQRTRLHLASRQAVVREVATEVGFTGTGDARELHKVSLNRVLVPNNWATVRDELLKAAEIGLPETMPAFRNVDQYVELQRPDGQRAHVTAFALESLLSPALVCMPGRAAVLVPIQREYSEHLLGHLNQLQLLPQEKALLYQQRHYLSAPKTLKVFTRGCLVFF
jgi:hypothetical protein